MCKKCQQKKNTVIILGDSHTRGCASEVQHNLDHDYRTQGTVKPGANLEEIISPPRNIISKLTKKDIVVIWGGTRDIGKTKQIKRLIR